MLQCLNIKFGDIIRLQKCTGYSCVLLSVLWPPQWCPILPPTRAHHLTLPYVLWWGAGAKLPPRDGEYWDDSWPRQGGTVGHWKPGQIWKAHETGSRLPRGQTSGKDCTGQTLHHKHYAILIQWIIGQNWCTQSQAGQLVYYTLLYYSKGQLASIYSIPFFSPRMNLRLICR